MTRAILFCSDFPLGYHNREPLRKLSGFAARGWSVTYVEKLGVRNPGPRHAAALLARLRAPASRAGDGPALPFPAVSPRLAPPRRAPGVDALNRAWLARQLLAHVGDPARTVLWLRYPTPEIVPFAERGDWAAVIYEVVDDHLHGPGIDARLGRVLRAAEDRLLRRAELVFAWSDALAEGLAPRHANVVVAPAAADLAGFAAARANAVPAERVAVYAGSLDFRFDAALVAETARALPDWRFRLAGPPDAEALAALGGAANVELLGPLAPEEVPPLLASGSVCLMPYRLTPFNDNLFPIKLIDGLASGRPVVATPIRSAREFGDVVGLASGPEAFAAAIQAAADDPPEAAERRIARAAPYDWEHRIDAMQAAIEAVMR
jgi:glycosyltransferase involved in cell wall biosynthesis